MQTTSRFTIAAISLLLIATLTACGGDDETAITSLEEDPAASADQADPLPSEASGESDRADEPAVDRADPPGTGDESESDTGDASASDFGTVTAQGQTHGFLEVVNCEPPDAGIPNHETLLAVSALGNDGIAVHVRISEIADTKIQDLDFYGPNGFFNGGASEIADGWYNAVDVTTPEPPLTITDDRLTGTVTVVNTRATDETLDIDVDIAYPSEVINC